MPESAPLRPTDENLMRFVFGDELSARHLREAVAGPAGSAYGEVVNSLTEPLWARRILPLKTTVLVNLAILATLNRPQELYTRIVGLLRGGVSVEEIKEVILHIGFYAGNPAGVEATVSLHDAMGYLDSQGIAYHQTTVS
jgi:alkylhydroperoxidase/carboxymuconolactone decarboxylase family protein YurZ